jgi:hypothetical protein
MIIIYFLIIIFIYICFYLCNLYLIKYEHYNSNGNNNILFLNKKELYNILIKNNDKYYETFYTNDYKTRNINNIDDYYNFIEQSVDDFTENDINKLNNCIIIANNFFKKINKKWFNGNKANEIKWIIGTIKGKLYENGLPHTRSNIIIISKDDISNNDTTKLVKTLIHEKVHIYQKIYHEDSEIFINEYNFIKHKLRDEKDNIRANPDLNKWIYKDMNGNIYSAIYNKNPVSIEDIKYKPFNGQTYEHPFEKMAIDIENIF